MQRPTGASSASNAHDQSPPTAPTQPEAWPPGHFYSPIPSLEDIRRREAKVFGPAPEQLPGIDLNAPHQLALLSQLAPHAQAHPWTVESGDDLRYRFDNDYFCRGEALILHGFLRHLRPARLVEVGSGFSTCATLDTNDVELAGKLHLTLIEPYTERVRKVVRPDDLDHVELIEKNLQDVDLAVFAQLRDGDVLFVDSTHVSKTDSDVNHLLFRILPSLRAGVYIHFHDIPYPFEYSRDWVYQGRAWNEAYILRAFLQYNVDFEIAFFNSFLACMHAERLFGEMPQLEGHAGTSIWLRRR